MYMFICHRRPQRLSPSPLGIWPIVNNDPKRQKKDPPQVGISPIIEIGSKAPQVPPIASALKTNHNPTKNNHLASQMATLYK